MRNFLVSYYFFSVIYCFFQLARTYRKEAYSDALNITPALDSIMVVVMGWALAPVDMVLRWISIYKKAEEARRYHADTDNSLDGIKYKKNKRRDGRVG